MINKCSFYFFFIGFLTIINGQYYQQEKILSIVEGTSFGFRRPYCCRSINITSNPYKLVAVKESNLGQAEYPLVSKTCSYSAKKWQELVNLVDSKKFRALNDVYGCPDCADGGAEYVEINWPSITKRVTFEYGKTIPGFEKLVNKLRPLRQQYADIL